MNEENAVTLKITPRKIYNKNSDQRLCSLCGEDLGEKRIEEIQ